ncbi:MAG: hypothetical protein GYA59_01480, partial [Chloroflexi bacterium]|nr:hypothetical protein [Chloroflexota bacterium]
MLSLVAVLLLAVRILQKPMSAPGSGIVELFVWIFLVSAGLGVWAAYDPQNALEKFIWIASAILLYYATAFQSQRNRGFVLASLSVLAGCIVGAFLLGYDWIATPVDIRVVNILGCLWMKIRPQTPIQPTSDDWVGGVMAVILPLQVALLELGKEQKKRGFLYLGVFGIIMAGLGVFFSGSRPAWLVLFVALVLQFGWRGGHHLNRPPRSVGFYLGGLLLLALLVGLGGWFSDELLFRFGWARQIHFASVSSRLEVYQNSLQLAKDYALWGGGLGSFPGLYSRYILGIPYLFAAYSHNFYLDVAVELGILGLGACLMVFLGSMAVLVQRLLHFELSSADRRFQWAVLVSMVVLLLHGWMEDAFFASWGVVGLFFLPGLSSSVCAGAQPSAESSPAAATGMPRTNKFWFAGSVVVVLFVVGYFLRNPLLSKIYANLGAVRMAKVELKGWPDQSVSDYEPLSGLENAVADLHRAIRYDPQNSGAHYRLGLVAVRSFDFTSAGEEFELAYAN